MKPKTNPFRTSKLDSIKFRSVNWQLILAHLAELKFCAAVIGPHGTGKTAFLLELQNHLESSFQKQIPYVHLAETSFPTLRFLTAIAGCNAPVCIIDDGIGEGNKTWWRIVWCLSRLLRGSRGLIVSAHKPVPLPTLHETHVDEGLFLQLVQELKPHLSDDDLIASRQIFLDQGGNMRESFLRLYDREFEIQHAHAASASSPASG